MKWEDVPKESVGTGISRRVIHGDNITLARFYLDAGATVSEHSHNNEQISYVMEGKLIFDIDGKSTEAHAGELFKIPPGVLHKVTAMEPSVVLDTFSPPRKDWMESKDEYFRK